MANMHYPWVVEIHTILRRLDATILVGKNLPSTSSAASGANALHEESADSLTLVPASSALSTAERTASLSTSFAMAIDERLRQCRVIGLAVLI
jgi:hypothetical protein